MNNQTESDLLVQSLQCDKEMHQLRCLLVGCLQKNDMFDAALSAIGYTLAGMAIRKNPKLIDVSRYYDPGDIHPPPDDLPHFGLARVTVAETRIDSLFSNALRIVEAISNDWDHILGYSNIVPVYDTVRVAFTPTPYGYSIQLVYVYVAASHRGQKYERPRAPALPQNPD